MEPQSITPNPVVLDQLQAVLEAEIAQYKLAAEKLSAKKEALVTNQPQHLGRIDRELLALSRKVTQLEQQRKSLMAELGYPEMSLESLIQHLEPQYARTLSRTREQLRRAVIDTQQLNRESQDLLDLSLRWIQETVEIIASALTPEAAGYTAQGGKAQSQEGNTHNRPTQSTISHSA